MLGALRSYIAASEAGSDSGAVRPLPPEPGEHVVPNPAADAEPAEPPRVACLPTSCSPMQFALFLAYYEGERHALRTAARGRVQAGGAQLAGDIT